LGAQFLCIICVFHPKIAVLHINAVYLQSWGSHFKKKTLLMRLLLLTSFLGFCQISLAQFTLQGRCNATEFTADSCANTVFENGNLASEGPMIDGRKHGEWWYYAEDGLLWMKVLFLDGKYRSDVNYLETAPGLAGANTFVVGWTPNQLSMEAQHWKRHLILYEGYSYPFDKKDWYVLRTSYRYKPGMGKPRQSVTVEHYIPRLATYDWPDLHSEDKRLLALNIPAVANGAQLKMLRSDLYRNSSPWSTEFLEVRHDPNAILSNGNGVWIGLQENNKTFVEIPFRNGKAEGNVVYFDPKGKKATEGAFSNGLQEGIWTEFHSNGNIKRTYTFKHDTICGPYASFHENGSTRLRCYVESATAGAKTDGSFTASVVFDLKLYKSISISGVVQAFEADGNQVFSMVYPYSVLLDAKFELGGKGQGEGNTSVLTGQKQQVVTNGQSTLIEKLNHRYDNDN
jgi:antitoxin component YwqK of YwqJK toxin-antitoxin module